MPKEAPWPGLATCLSRSANRCNVGDHAGVQAILLHAAKQLQGHVCLLNLAARALASGRLMLPNVNSHSPHVQLSNAELQVLASGNLGHASAVQECLHLRGHPLFFKTVVLELRHTRSRRECQTTNIPTMMLNKVAVQSKAHHLKLCIRESYQNRIVLFTYNGKASSIKAPEVLGTRPSPPNNSSPSTNNATRPLTKALPTTFCC